MSKSSRTAASRLLIRLDADFGHGCCSPSFWRYRLARRVIDAKACDRVAAIEKLLHGSSIGRTILRAVFVRIFRRLPEPEALDQWVAHIGAGGNATQLLIIWLSGDEYFSQRAHESNALFASVLVSDLMLTGFADIEAEIETRLTKGDDRSTIVGETVRHALNRGWIGRNLALRLGLDPVLGEQVAIEATEPDPLRRLLITLLASDSYIESASIFTSAARAVGDRLAHALHHEYPFLAANDIADLGERISRDIFEYERPVRAISQFMRGNDALLEHETQNVILPALVAAGVSEATIRTVSATLQREDVRALCDGPIASRLCEALEKFDNAELAAARDLLSYGDKLVEHWEEKCRPFVAAIVAQWRGRIQSAAKPQTMRRDDYWTERLLANEYYFAVLAEFYADCDVLGADPVVFYDGPLSIAPLAGSLVHFEANEPLAPVAAETRMRLTTTFFYWYDAYYSRAMLSSPDTLEESDDLALTLRPPTLDDFSYLSFRWNRKELADLASAGVDVVLPVYYGTPISDPIQILSPFDRARNVRNQHAEPGLRMIRRAFQASNDGDMRVALFYDTTSLNRANTKHIQFNFAFKVSYDWFYETIRSFFSHLPRSLWALRFGRPIIFVYHPCFGVNLRSDLYPFVRQRFKQDFGVDPFIVTASEEEAPRVLQNDFVAAIARKLTYENWRDQLAELLADDHLFAASGGRVDNYAQNLLVALLGQTNGKASCQPEAVFVKPSGGFVSSNTVSPAEAAAREALRKQLVDKIGAVGRKAAVLSLLTSDDFIGWQVDDMILRYLRTAKTDWTESHHALAARLTQMLHRGEPYAECLCEIFLTKEFAAAAGGENRVIDLVYQSLVWRCPNPEYINNHTTIDDAGRRAFLDRERTGSRAEALRWFLQRFEVAEAVVSDWLFKFYRWYNPGPADSAFYWGGAIAPVIRDVAAVGPGYDQSAIRTRPGMVQPRHDGQRYCDQLNWVGAMVPRPWMLHLETWNEFFEGTCICDCEEFGRQYIDITDEFAHALRKARADEPVAAVTSRPRSKESTTGSTMREDLQRLFEGCHWHQRWEIEPGVFTPGANSVSDIMNWTSMPASLAGKRILDIGAWNGCFSFECERRGAAEVLAIGPEHPDHTGFTRLKEFLDSKVQYRLGSIYHLQPEEIGTFDVVMCFGVIYHLRYPLLGIDMIRRIARGALHLETYAMPGDGPPLWEFYRNDELNKDPSNWFGPNKKAVEEMLLSSGFTPISVTAHPNNRVAAFAQTAPGKPEWLTMASGEGFYYDVITRPVLGDADVY